MTSDRETHSASATSVVRICELFSAALEVPGIAPDTDFFLAGGNSLSALALAVSIEKTFGARVRVRDVIEYGTPERLAERFGTRRDSVRPPSGSADGATAQAPSGGEPVGAATQWLWLERQRGAGASAAYTVASLLDGDGELIIAKFEAAVGALCERHPILRRTFIETRGTVWSVPAPPSPLLEVIDLSGECPSSQEFSAMAAERALISFDPQTGPLFTVTVYLRGRGAWSVLLVADHLVCDGRSVEIIARDLVDLYQDSSAARPRRASRREPPPDVSLAYWRRVMSPPPAPLALPVNRPRTGPAGVTTGIVESEIATEVLEQLSSVARTVRTSLFTPLAAAVILGLAELTGSSDICVGTPVDRRSRAGSDDIVGFEVATVPLRVAVPADTNPSGLVRAVAACVVDAVDHSDASFAQIVAAVAPPRHAWRTPMFDVWVALYPYVDTGQVAPDGIALRGGPLPLRQGMFELSFQFTEHAAGLRQVLQYDADRYEPETARRIARRVTAVTDRIAGRRATEPAGEADPARRAGVRAFNGFRFE